MSAMTLEVLIWFYMSIHAEILIPPGFIRGRHGELVPTCAIVLVEDKKV